LGFLGEAAKGILGDILQEYLRSVSSRNPKGNCKEVSGILEESLP